MRISYLVILSVFMLILLGTPNNTSLTQSYEVEGLALPTAPEAEAVLSTDFQYTTLVTGTEDYHFQSIAMSGDTVIYPVDFSILKLFAHDVGRGETRELLHSVYIPPCCTVAYQHFAIFADHGESVHSSEPSAILQCDYYDYQLSQLIPANDYDQYMDLSLSYPYLVFVHDYYSTPDAGSLHKASLDQYNLVTGEITSIVEHEISDPLDRVVLSKPVVDERCIVWIQSDRMHSYTELWVYDMESDTSVKLLDSPSYMGIVSTAVDNGILIYSRLTGDSAKTQIQALNLATGAQWIIADCPTHHTNLQMDGDHVVWEQYEPPDGCTDDDCSQMYWESNVYLHDLVTGETSRVTNEPGRQCFPEIKGDRIVYADNSAGVFELRMAEFAARPPDYPDSDLAQEMYNSGQGEVLLDETFVREDEWVCSETRIFGPAPAASEGQTVLWIRNGDINGNYRTKQATVWINGVEVVSGIVFNQIFESMAIFVDFLPNQDNIVEIEIGGTPGSQIAVGILEVKDYSDSDPIFVYNNEDFGALGYNFPGNGLVDDPYIIEGYRISDSAKTLIHIQDTTAHFAIRNCLLDGIDGSNYGIYFSNVENGRIETNNIQYTSTGIYLSWTGPCTSNVIVGNTIHDNAGYGIYTYGGLSNEISNNIIEDNTQDGIALFHSDYTTVTGNTITNNGWRGVFLVESSHNTVTSCTLHGHSQSVELQSNCEGNIVSDNIMADNSESGIALSGTSFNTISGNTVYNNVYTGIYLYSATHETITDNTIRNNGRKGIELSSSDYNTISNNLIENNLEFGIIFYSSNYNTISENEIVNSALFGVIISSPSEGNTIEWNDMIGNNEPGSQAFDTGLNNVFQYNLWDDWQTPDDFAPFGIVDVPYPIYADNEDPFPRTASPANNPPTADAGYAVTIDEGSIAVFDASGSSDPDGDELQFRWDFESDGTWDTGWSDSPMATKQYDDDFFGVATVDVTDGEHSATALVEILVQNVAPIASLSNDGPVFEGSPVIVSFDNQLDPSPLDEFYYSFDWDSDGVYDIVDQVDPSASHIWSDDGTFLVTARISDDDGGFNQYTTEVVVENSPPVVVPRGSFSLLEGLKSMPMTLVWFTDPGTSDTHTARIDWGDDCLEWGKVSEVNGQGSVGLHSHIYANNHIYIIKVTVADDDGARAYGYIEVTVRNVAPTPSIDLVVNPSGDFILPGDEVEFYGSVWDPGIYDKIFTEWDFGDGSPVIHGGLTPTHAFAQSGEYIVTLTATDSDGDSRSVTVNIVVDTPQDVTEEIQDELLGIDPPPEAQDEIDKAIGNLDDAIDAFENDDVKTAYDELKDVVRDLMKAQSEGADTQEVIDDILAFLEDLARLAIEDAAEAVGADDERVVKAQEYFDLAMAYIASGEYDKAVDELRKAYEEAMKALG